MHNRHALIGARAGVRAAVRQKLLLSTLLPLAAVIAAPAIGQSLPSGGQVVSGQASIDAPVNGQLTIDQASNKAIIDWDGFSVGKGNTVQFNNGSGATLNRVTGTSVSSIDGLLSATGSVYLLNPNGVIVGQKGVVSVGGTFVASTLGLDNAGFMAGGDQTFAGNSTASVVNLGKVGALGGSVALIGSNVRNEGSISAPNGTVGLVAGHKVLMRDADLGGNFLVLSGGSDTAAGNTGAVDAAAVRLQAEGGNIYALAGNTDGVLKATGISSQNGKVYLTAGTGGSVQVSGTQISASGGDIALSGKTIDVASDVRLDASAAQGDGGRITAIADMADGSLNFHGQALARSDAGNGGFVETSGANVNFDGARVDTSSAQGKTGEWLTDPFDLTVDSAAASTIATNLATTNVTLQTTASGTSGPGTANSAGSGDITINAPISWASGNTLTLDAYRSINANANLTVSGAGGVVLKTNNGGSGGDYSFNGGKSLSFTGGSGSGASLTINGTVYTLVYSMAQLDLIDGTDQQAGTGTAVSAGGNYALAASLDAAGFTYSKGLVGTGSSLFFSGAFTGLGNTISNLTISHASNSSLGLFGAISSGATIRDIGLISPTVTQTAGSGNSYGALVGQAVSGSNVIKNVYATNVNVSGALDTGGLIGRLDSGTLTGAFVTGTVTSNASSGTNATGGLIGRSKTGVAAGAFQVSNAYSTANVTAATGSAVTYIGGLVGDVASGGSTLFGSFNNVYSTGTVTVSSGATVTAEGGLFGRFGSSASSLASVSNAFSSGAVVNNGTTTSVGKVLGSRFSGSLVSGASTATNPTATVFYASNGSAGPTAASGGAVANSNGIGSQTTAQLQALNFDATQWATNSALGLYPFLTRFAATNTVAGIATTTGGANAANVAVKIYANGALLSTATSAGDGSYSYNYLTPLGNAATYKIGATLTLNGDSSLTGASFTDGATSAFNVASGTYAYTTKATAYSTLASDLSSTFGSDYAGLASAQPAGKLKVLAANAFTVDQAISQTGAVLIQAAGGDLTVASGGSVSSSATGDAIVLAANGAFKNNGTAASVAASGGRWLIYSQAFNDAANLASGDVTGGLTGKSFYNDAYNFTTSSFASAPNSGNRFVHGYAPTLTVSAATKSVVYTGAAQTDTFSATGYLSVADQAADSLTGAVGGMTTSSKNVGTYTLTPTGSLVSDENYGITFGGAGVLTITPAALTLTAVSDSRAYNGTTSSTGAPTPSGLKGTDTVTGLSQSFDSPNAGTRVLSVNAGYTLNDGNAGANYTVSTVTAGGTINALGVTGVNWLVANASSTYGTLPVLGAVTLTGVLSADVGQVQGTAGLFSGSTQITPTATTGVGTYSEQVTGLTGSKASNYFLLASGNTAGVYIINPKVLTASLIGSVTKTYNGSIAASLTSGNYSLSGVLARDTVSLNTAATGTYDNKNAGSGKTVSVAGLSLAGTSAGNYTVNSSASAAIGTINKAAITLGLVGTTGKTYDGTTSAALTAANYALTGAVAGDNVTVAGGTTGAYADANAGTAKVVSVSGLSLSGTDAGNYTANATASAAIGAISKRSIAVQGDALSKSFGQADPALTYHLSSGTLVTGDSLTGALTRDAGETPGAYAVTQGSLAASSNYTMAFTPGSLTVQSSVPMQDNVLPVEAADPGVRSWSFDYNAGLGKSGKKPKSRRSACDTDAASDACANTPYPTNQNVSSFIKFSGL